MQVLLNPLSRLSVTAPFQLSTMVLSSCYLIETNLFKGVGSSMATIFIVWMPISSVDWKNERKNESMTLSYIFLHSSCCKILDSVKLFQYPNQGFVYACNQQQPPKNNSPTILSICIWVHLTFVNLFLLKNQSANGKNWCI
jgi:hypothetical protein